ncbi:hypothetical protein OS493_018690 [Desmophyllum pertusum]|uniref:Uncharacterized protein n=1 Tax=Desmophyllum pertusum TaxID=174260 RepID=A0A9X0D3A3_9CNID|nr:hypothetical protein OS493_018690 [Desmophyllum pertusum]
MDKDLRKKKCQQRMRTLQRVIWIRMLQKSTQMKNTEPSISIDNNFQEVKVIDTSEHKLTSCTKTRISSSLLCTGHQSRNIRVKKRGAISSAWLEKYKPELPDDADHLVLPSDSLVENTSESENIFSDEKNSIAEEKGLDREKYYFVNKLAK